MEFTPSWQCMCFLTLLETSRSSRTPSPLLHTRSGQNTFTITQLATSPHFVCIIYLACRRLPALQPPLQISSPQRLCIWTDVLPAAAAAASMRGDSWQGVWYMCFCGEWSAGGRGAVAGGISSAMLTMCQRRCGRRLFPIFGKSLSIAPPWRDGPPQ